MSRPELWIVAGPNGAGKTTFIQREPLTDWLGSAEMLNADNVTLGLLKQEGFQGFSDVPAEDLKRLFIAAAEKVQHDAEACWILAAVCALRQS